MEPGRTSRKPRPETRSLPKNQSPGRGFFLEHRDLSEVSAPASAKVPPLVRSGVSSNGPPDREAPVGLCPNVPGLLLFRNIKVRPDFDMSGLHQAFPGLTCKSRKDQKRMLGEVIATYRQDAEIMTDAATENIPLVLSAF